MRIRNLMTAVAAVALGVWATAAGAATYYVSPSGSSANAGTSAAPWNLSKANSALVAGDVAILLPGNYGTSTIAPANSGSSYSKFIAYVGSLSNPASTVVTGVNFGAAGAARKFVSVKGVQVGTSTTLNGSNDSLAWCLSTAGSLSIELGADGCVVANCAFTGDKVWVEGGLNGPSASLVTRDTLYNCSFNLSMNGYGPAIRINATDGLTIRRCRFVAVIGTSEDHGTFKIYGSRNGRFTDNYFDFTNLRSTACDECGLGYFRDYTTQNVFLRDTLVFRASGSNMNTLFVSASGSFPGTVVGNRYDGCVWIQEAPVSTGAMYWQNGAQGDTVQNCMVVSAAGTPIEMSGFSNNCVVRHNTFAYLGTNGHAGDTFAGGAFDWSGPGVVKDNIFYSPNGNSYAYGVDAAQFSQYTGNNNLLFNGKGASTSLYWGTAQTSPGSSGSACTKNSQECASKYGDPLFVGGADVFGFDAHLKTGSPAIGAASDGGDIGALPFGTGGSDVTRPSPITNLAVAQTNDNSVLLTWTATGDDDASGQAAVYELKLSSTPITDANFASAGTVSIAVAPKAAGSAEQFVVGGLTPGTVYYFAIRAIDDAGNVGLSSNSPTTTTLGSDTVPPGQIKDLNAGQ